MYWGTPKPVTILTGYLGSGKTTVLNEVLKDERAARTAVIVNDIGSVSIDASLIKKTNVRKNNIDMVELTNGCICRSMILPGRKTSKGFWWRLPESAIPPQ